MKKRIIILFSSLLLLSACTPANDTIIGEWNADKVNVQFDENLATPELVKQIGEMEKQNHLSISKDSTLVFKGIDSEWQGRMTVDKDVIYCDGKEFGLWQEGNIVTTTPSPLGDIVITYRKTTLRSPRTSSYKR